MWFLWCLPNVLDDRTSNRGGPAPGVVEDREDRARELLSAAVRAGMRMTIREQPAVFTPTFLVSVILSILVWHHVGSFECVKQSLVLSDEDYPVYYARRNQQSKIVAWQEDDPNLNRAQLQQGRPQFDGTNAMNDRSTIPRPATPYKCGVVWFYHIPCTGGEKRRRPGSG